MIGVVFIPSVVGQTPEGSFLVSMVRTRRKKVLRDCHKGRPRTGPVNEEAVAGWDKSKIDEMKTSQTPGYDLISLY